MNRATFTIAAIAFLCIAAATSPPVTFESPCECRDAHGKARLVVKNDPSLPPTNASAIQSVTPSEIFNWRGPDVPLAGQSGRTGIENNWYALTGCVVAVKAETDGDLHIELQDALVINRASLLFEYRPNRTGVTFATRFLVGRVRNSLSTLALPRS